MGCALLAQAANADVWEDLAKFEYTDGNNVAQEAEHQLRAIPVADHPKVEAKLIALLSAKNATQAGKSIACRLLQRIGTAKAVPALSALLADEILCHYALLALERLQSPKADKAMRDALDKVPAKVKVSLVGSLGVRRDSEALKAIQALAKGKEMPLTDLATAAKTHEVIFAADLSAKKNRPVKLSELRA